MEKNLPEIGNKIYQLWGQDCSKCQPAWVKITTTDDKGTLKPYATKLGPLYQQYKIVTLSVEKTNEDLKKCLTGKELLRATMNYILDHPDDFDANTIRKNFIGIAQELSGEDSPLSNIQNFYTQLLSINLPQYCWLEDEKRTIPELYVFVSERLNKDRSAINRLPKL